MPKKTGKPRAKTEKTEQEGLTQVEIAALAKCSQSTVNRAIKRGDIETLWNGRIAASEAEKLIELRKEEERSNAEHAVLERRLHIAETDKAEAIAKLKAMEVDHKSGRFIELEGVLRDAADTREKVLAILRAVPQRTAMALECPCRRAAVVESKISDEVERAINEIRKSRFDK